MVFGPFSKQERRDQKTADRKKEVHSEKAIAKTLTMSRYNSHDAKTS